MNGPFGRLRDGAGALWNMDLWEAGISAATAQT